MKNLYKMTNTWVKVDNKTELYEYLNLAEEVGWKWNSGNLPSQPTIKFNLYPNYLRVGRILLVVREPYLSESINTLTLTQLKERLMEDEWKEGMLLYDGEDKKKILATIGKVFILSTPNNFTRAGASYTKEELIELEYGLYHEPQPVTEVHLSIEELEAKLNLTSGSLRIKKEEN